MRRVEGLLKLYTLLKNRRKRAIRRDWARKFLVLMHWPKGETIERVDGEHALVIIREASEIKAVSFGHDDLADLLRAALVASVSALDRYCHDVLVSRVIHEIKRSERTWPRELRRVKISLSVVKTAITHAGKRRGKGGKIRPRPMNMIRHALQEQFHRDLTLQGSEDIAQALSMLGVRSLWNECASRLKEKPKELTRHLDAIVRRRNQIVHEGDLKRFRRGGRVTLNLIEPAVVRQDVNWLKSLVAILGRVLE